LWWSLPFALDGKGHYRKITWKLEREYEWEWERRCMRKYGRLHLEDNEKL
jgi:hypothetical protein